MLTEVQSTQSRKTTLALLALSVGGFGIGLTEFIIAGLLTEVAGARPDPRATGPAADDEGGVSCKGHLRTA